MKESSLENNIYSIKGNETFQNFLKEHNDKEVVVLFYANYSKVSIDIYKEFQAQAYICEGYDHKIVFAKVDIISNAISLPSLVHPSVYLFKDEKVEGNVNIDPRINVGNEFIQPFLRMKSEVF